MRCVASRSATVTCVASVLGWAISRSVFRWNDVTELADVRSTRFVTSLDLALDGILAFSIVPLRIATALGALGLLGGLLYAVFALVARLATGSVPQGFTTLALLQIAFGGAVLLMLGVLGEYVGRIYEEVKGRPVYLVERVYGDPTVMHSRGLRNQAASDPQEGRPTSSPTAFR